MYYQNVDELFEFKRNTYCIYQEFCTLSQLRNVNFVPNLDLFLYQISIDLSKSDFYLCKFANFS